MSQKQIAIIKQQFSIQNGQPVITSQQIATAFGKEHRNVLRDIETLECSSEFRLLNFEQTIWERENPKGGAAIPARMFNITKDGFILLVMGYNGRAAFRLKEAYILAFNAMEAELRSGMEQTRALAADALLTLCAEAGRCGYPADFVPQLVRYRRLGLTQREISRLLKISTSTASDWCRHLVACGVDLPKRIYSTDITAAFKRDKGGAAQVKQLPLFQGGKA